MSHLLCNKACLNVCNIALLGLLIIVILLLLTKVKLDQNIGGDDISSLRNYVKAIKQCQVMLHSMEHKYDSDKPTLHANYFGPYAQFLCPWKAEGKEVSILEFGVDFHFSFLTNIGGFGEELKGGADLFTWSRFFPKAKVIIGVDISKKSFHVAPNVKMFQASQVDEKAVNEICEKYGPFDLIVDDGSHMVDHVIATFKLVWKCLKYDGLYVLEVCSAFV
ncbi:unnamed protein product [Toxocara canis]|uniref:Methyltranfer_dom domain-containing protein n=1 Tax=Toxocara canis TaxID=6265 RepID=A0A183U0M1_TOXCA|nr:unnamed protein product [Toxocara canis]